MQEQVALFKSRLEEFSRKHKKDINSDPTFRYEFAKLTSSIGVDPLASRKGFWAELLGVGDFYYELGVQIVDVCLSTRPLNGGLMDVTDLLRRLRLMRGSNAQRLGLDDVTRAVKKLGVLGNGFRMVNVGAKNLILSVPYELNTDQSLVLTSAEV